MKNYLEIKLDTETANKYAMADVVLVMSVKGEEEKIINKEYMMDHEGNIYVPMSSKRIKKMKSLIEHMDYAELQITFDYDGEPRVKCIPHSVIQEIINEGTVIYL